MARKNSGIGVTPTEIQQAFAATEWGNKFPPVLTVEQAAELLEIPKSTIYDWSSRGLLRGCSRRVGKHLRIWRDRLLILAFNEGVTSNA